MRLNFRPKALGAGDLDNYADEIAQIVQEQSSAS